MVETAHDTRKPTRRATLRAEQKQATRTRLMESAYEQFCAPGYAAVTIDDIASADPLPEVMQMMSSPLSKGQIMARSRKEGVSEGTMRNLVRADFMLAARDDSTSLAEGKLRDAIARAKPYRN